MLSSSYSHSPSTSFPSSTPRTPLRIMKSTDKQASIFLHQKLKVAGPRGVACIVNAICAHGGELMIHRNAPLPFLVCVCAMLIIPALRYGSATGPFSAVSKPPRALRNAVRSSRACAAASSTSQLLRVLRPPEGSRLRGGGDLLPECVGDASEVPRGQVGRACMP
ncbi:hypothetical protein B0H13DRAFT_1006924 [Mycena leptocephala]|nr:hypothetical protein B0H13DRAFT_1006924 [Mycena leptocephala]